MAWHGMAYDVGLLAVPSLVSACKTVVRTSIGGSVVECSPATRAARVRFPADALSFYVSLACLCGHHRYYIVMMRAYFGTRPQRRASVAQWLARSAVNRKVGGSTPPGGASSLYARVRLATWGRAMATVGTSCIAAPPSVMFCCCSLCTVLCRVR